MWKNRIFWTMGLVALMAMPAWSAGRSGKGPDYSRMADMYIQGVEAAADFTCWDIEWQAEHAAAVIEKLLYAGREDKAQAVADRTLNAIERQSNRTIAHIQKSGENLADFLQKKDQAELADEVLSASAAAAEKIQIAADNACWLLEDLFFIGAE